MPYVIPFQSWAQWLLVCGLAIRIETGKGDYILILEN